MPEIDPTARVHRDARIAPDVTIGPYCIVGPEITLADGCHLVASVHITGLTSIGEGTVVHPNAVLGAAPQSISYKGERTRLEIGARCTIREAVTMHVGTVDGGGVTRVGDGGLFMVGCHIAHDCQIGNDVIFANGATLGGHAIVEDQVFVGGLVGIHQFGCIGRGAILAGGTHVLDDIAPFTIAMGSPARLVGMNVVGLKRRNCPPASIRALRTAYRILFLGPGLIRERLARAEAEVGHDPYAAHMLTFVRGPRKRRLSPARRRRVASSDD